METKRTTGLVFEGEEINKRRTILLKSLIAERLSNLIRNSHSDFYNVYPLETFKINKYLDNQNKKRQPTLAYFLSRCPIIESEFTKKGERSILYGIAYDVANFHKNRVESPSFISLYRQSLIENSQAGKKITKNEALWLNIINILEFMKKNSQGKNKNRR